MRLYTVSSIDSWIMMAQPGKVGKSAGKQVPRLGKNGGPLCVTDGMISSLKNCRGFVRAKLQMGCVSTSKIRVWKGQ